MQSVVHQVPDFINYVKAINYKNIKQIYELSKYLDRSYFAPLHLGSNGSYHFKLVPGSGELIPREAERAHHPDPEMLTIMLGINMHFNVGHVLGSSDDSTYGGQGPTYARGKEVHVEATKRPPLDIFVQLGSINRYPKGQPSDPNPRTGVVPTGYTLVMDVSDGRPGAIYMVFNFYPFDDEGDERYEYEDNIPFLGPEDARFIDAPKGSFSVAFLADDLDESLFGMDKIFRPYIKCRTKPELVTVRQNQSSLQLYKDPDIAPQKPVEDTGSSRREGP